MVFICTRYIGHFFDVVINLVDIVAITFLILMLNEVSVSYNGLTVEQLNEELTCKLKCSFSESTVFEAGVAILDFVVGSTVIFEWIYEGNLSLYSLYLEFIMCNLVSVQVYEVPFLLGQLHVSRSVSFVALAWFVAILQG